MAHYKDISPYDLHNLIRDFIFAPKNKTQEG